MAEEKKTNSQGYKTIYQGGVGELTEKKSRFIATVAHVETEQEAVAFIEEIKKKYWDATHNCSAFVLGKQGEVTRCSDDGEPGGTAGRPMLDVLINSGLRDVCVVVTRYFGGTLLGTGGLVRAYSAAVMEGIRQSQVVEKILAKGVKLVCEYTDVGKLQYLLARENRIILSTEYTDRVTFTLLIPVSEYKAWEASLVEACAGRIHPEEMDEVYYGMAGGEVKIFEE